eukprot:ctg_1068.g435
MHLRLGVGRPAHTHHPVRVRHPVRAAHRLGVDELIRHLTLHRRTHTRLATHRHRRHPRQLDRLESVLHLVEPALGREDGDVAIVPGTASPVHGESSTGFSAPRNSLDDRGRSVRRAIHRSTGTVVAPGAPQRTRLPPASALRFPHPTAAGVAFGRTFHHSHLHNGQRAVSHVRESLSGAGRGGHGGGAGYSGDGRVRHPARVRRLSGHDHAERGVAAAYPLYQQAVAGGATGGVHGGAGGSRQGLHRLEQAAGGAGGRAEDGGQVEQVAGGTLYYAAHCRVRGGGSGGFVPAGRLAAVSQVRSRVRCVSAHGGGECGRRRRGGRHRGGCGAERGGDTARGARPPGAERVAQAVAAGHQAARRRRGDLFRLRGIDAVRAALKAGEAAVADANMPIKIRLVAPPHYVVTTSAMQKHEGLEALTRVLEVVRAQIEARKGKCVVKAEPRTVSERDDRLLSSLMAELELKNREVAGDDDDDDAD